MFFCCWHIWNNAGTIITIAFVKERNALLLLLLTSFIWGLSFVAQSVSSDLVGPFTFNGIRMLIGAVVLIPFSYKSLKSRNNGYFIKLLKSGAVCGLLLASASMMQQIGVAYSTAGKAGFITSIYIIIVPIISLLFHQKVKKKIWLCALVAIFGMYLLCMDTSSLSLSKGDAYLLLCAILFAFHIMAIDHYAKDLDGIDLSMVQFFTAAVICLIGMVLFEDPSISALKKSWLPIFYAGAFSCGIAYTLQTVGQKYVKPTLATLALSLESVWAAIGGAVILSERMSPREIIGCILVFSAVLLSQMHLKKKGSSDFA